MAPVLVARYDAGMAGLTRKQAAALAGVSEETVKGWLRRGVLRPALPGRTQRLLPEDVLAAQRQWHAGPVVPVWRADPPAAGARLRAMREVAGLTQIELAARSALSHDEISRLEAGAKAPQAATVARLARGLDCEPERFVADTPVGLQTVSVAEAAARLGVPHDRVQRWMRTGELPGVKLGGRWRIRVVILAELERSGRLRGASRRLDR